MRLRKCRSAESLHSKTDPAVIRHSRSAYLMPGNMYRVQESIREMSCDSDESIRKNNNIQYIIIGNDLFI